MGWDAHAKHRSGNTIVLDNHTEQGYLRIVDGKLRKAFTAAAERVKSKHGSVDGYLHIGSLDCSDCAEALQIATGMDCWSEEDLLHTQVKEYNKNANWEHPDLKDLHPMLVASAKEFLSVCAKHNLRIEFTW
ncbi:MAG: hypothetical protein PVI90_11730 [Desulfobacteraceae bacterium]